MKTLNLKINLDNIQLAEDDKSKTGTEIAMLMIKNILLGYGNQRQGFNEEERRKYYKIADIFDKALEEKKDEIQIDDEYMNFIREGFKNTKLMPNDLLRKVEEAVNNVK